MTRSPISPSPPTPVDSTGGKRSAVTDENHRPGLDEQTFGKLIEAAYVLQEHNREMREMEESLELHSEQLRQEQSAAEVASPQTNKDKEAPENVVPGDYTLTLAEIVEAQHQIQRRHLELGPAMALVAERVARITNSSGAAIALLDGKTVRYRAGAGPTALPTGTEVTLDAAICAASVRTGQVIRSEDVSLEFLFDAEGCLQRGIQSLVSVPIYHDGNIAGALELYFDKIRGFIEQDVHTCQLMAGLVTEAIGRDMETSLKKSVASERSTMLEAIEKLKPDLIALVDQTTASVAKNSSPAASSGSNSLVCRKCGNTVLSVEQFCGKCGESRVSGREPSEIQRKVAAAWQLEQAGLEKRGAAASSGSSSLQESSRFTPVPSLLDDLEKEEALYQTREAISPPWEERLAFGHDAKSPAANQIDAEAIIRKAIPLAASASPSGAEAATALAKPKSDVTWSSAAKAREFLETLSSSRGSSALARFWRERRGTFYLVLAVILVLVAIRWGILSENDAGAAARGPAVSGAATRHKPPNPEADLSSFDKLLINLGLAEPPPAPEYKGNPYVQVWVDSHTALYYCPGSELYGKTPQGRYASQRDAEMDQFEPAERKACD
jgi:putative methionine-R-sulfoxide reductase with GAF domain